jgi:hypothetical protein
MILAKRSYLSFKFLRVVHDRVAFIVGEFTFPMGKANQPFRHAHEVLNLWPYIHFQRDAPVR